MLPADHRVSRGEAADSGTGEGRLGDPAGVAPAGSQAGAGLLRGGLDG